MRERRRRLRNPFDQDDRVRGDALARHLRELGNVRFLAKSRARLIERNVAALTQTEDHQIEPPGCLNGGVVVRRVLGIRIRVRGVHGRQTALPP